jgi:hypothetical protein
MLVSNDIDNVGLLILPNVPLWCGMLIVGEAVCVRKQAMYENSLYLLFTFVVNLKLL